MKKINKLDLIYQNLGDMAAVYNYPLNPRATEIYGEELLFFDYDLLETVFRKHLASVKFFPKIADIYDIIGQDQDERNQEKKHLLYRREMIDSCEEDCQSGRITHKERDDLLVEKAQMIKYNRWPSLMQSLPKPKQPLNEK